MNPIMIMAAIGVGAIGLTMLAKKSNAAIRWVQAYWQRRVALPADFVMVPESTATQLLENSGSTQFYNDRLTTRCLIGTQVYAADNAVVVSMNPIPGRLGQIIGLAHLTRRGESSLYVGVMPDVGIGSLVRKGGTIGSTDIDALTFYVKQSDIPEMRRPSTDPQWWLQTYNVSVS